MVDFGGCFQGKEKRNLLGCDRGTFGGCALLLPCVSQRSALVGKLSGPWLVMWLSGVREQGV